MCFSQREPSTNQTGIHEIGRFYFVATSMHSPAWQEDRQYHAQKLLLAPAIQCHGIASHGIVPQFGRHCGESRWRNLPKGGKKVLRGSTTKKQMGVEAPPDGS